MRHEDIVNRIRQFRDSGTGELTLTIRPNALYTALTGTDKSSEEEPPYRLLFYSNKLCIILLIKVSSINFYSNFSSFFCRYVPDVPHLTVGSDALAQSMLLLADGLASGALISQYEQLYKKNLELASLESKKPENQNKNRYRDISPCKSTFECKFFNNFL